MFIYRYKNTTNNEMEENNMSEDSRHCPECGGSDGLHYSDCTYDGTDGPRGYSNGSRRGSSSSNGMVWILYIIALLIGYGINELLGTILLIGVIVWGITCK